MAPFGIVGDKAERPDGGAKRTSPILNSEMVGLPDASIL